MKKPLFRWTIGPVHPRGFNILSLSVSCAVKIYENLFDFVICHNGLTEKQLEILNTIVCDKPVQLFKQSWELNPIADEKCQSNKDENGFFNSKGTLWKVCPPRMRPESPEIIVDNDLIIFKPLEQIAEFLEKQDHTMISEDRLNYLGRYSHLFPQDTRFNSGFLGLPPHFDFYSSIKQNWEKYGKYTDINADDEQGLLTYSLTQDVKHVVVGLDTIVTLPKCKIGADDYMFTGAEKAIHFVESNKFRSHYYWDAYNQFVKTGKNAGRRSVKLKLQAVDRIND